MRKTRFGIIGGMGSNAGIAFLAEVVKKSTAIKDQDFPDFIYHNNATVPDRTQHIVNDGPSPVSQLMQSVKLFEDHGVDYMTSTCITSFYFEPILGLQTDIPIINPIRLLARELNMKYPDVRKVGVLATKGTIEAGLFDEILAREGYEMAYPTPEETDMVMNAIYGPFGLKSSDTSMDSIHSIQSMIPLLQERGADLIVAGCTEIPLALANLETSIPWIDPMELLASEIIRLDEEIKQTSGSCDQLTVHV